MTFSGRKKRFALALASPLLLLGVLAMANSRVDSPTNYRTSAALREPPSALSEPLRLRIATFNIADGYLFTTNRRERMQAIAEKLTALDPDLVGLQESFVASDRAFLLEALRASRLQHHVRFPGALVGNGLLILSAWPIEESWFHRFGNGGAWWRFWEGDFWAGKGVGLARVRVPQSDGREGWLDFYDTHAVAGRGNPDNESVRLDQMAELAHFVTESRLRTAPAFVVGDFNTEPGAPDYQLAEREAGLDRAMVLPSRIDHIFAVRDERYEFEVNETLEILGRTQGSGPAIFIARPPTLGELWDMLFGAPQETPLSDHPGYLSELVVRPRSS